MAIRLLNLAKRVPRLKPKVRGARAHVLLLLADHADEQGLAWPSAKTLAEEAGLTERTVRDALHVIEDEGLIFAAERILGHSTRWQLLLEGAGPCVTDMALPTPEIASGVNDEAPRKMLPGHPGNPRTSPRKSTHLTPENPSDITTKNHHKNHQGIRQRGARAGGRLPADWEPSAVDAAFARALGLDPTRVAERFRDYWHGKAGAGAAKADWPATWRNWCRRDAETRSASQSTARHSPRVDTATWLAGFGPASEDEFGGRSFIESEGNAG